MALDGDAGQVDGGKGQVATGVGDLLGGVVDVADDTGAAAHGGYLGLRMAGLVVLQVIGAVQEHVVGEQPLGGHLAAQAEQVVVGVALVVVDPLLDLEDVDGEDAGLAMAQARIQGHEDIADDHAALGGGVGAVVDGGKRRLGTGAGVHGVEIVDEALHGLVRLPLGLGLGTAAGTGHQMGGLGGIHIQMGGQAGGHGGVKPGRGLQAVFALVGHGGGHDVLHLIGQILGVQGVLHNFGELFHILLAEGLGHADGHAVVKVGDGLAAVLVVLVGLDGDGGQGGVAHDGLGLPQEAVARGEAVLEQADDVDLGAGGGKGVEVEIVDVDVALPVGLGVLGPQEVGLVVGLGTGGADLQHGAHGGVAVDVGVVTL